MQFWYEFSDEWQVDSTWPDPGTYNAARPDEEHSFWVEFCLAGPQPA